MTASLLRAFPLSWKALYTPASAPDPSTSTAEATLILTLVAPAVSAAFSY